MLEVEDIEDVVGPGTVGPKDRVQKERVLPRSLRRKPEAIQRELPEGDSFIPGGSSVYVKTWGCTHNTSDGEYMAGLLAASGYVVVDAPLSAHVWLLNSCTVKSPSEASFLSAVEKGRELGKVVVVAGCVPQGQKKHTGLQGLSAIGVQQIDRVVEVVEQALQGHTVQLLGPRRVNRHRQPGPKLDLPKIRKNPLIEIIPINSGCLNRCTYCKTKHARGDLASYSPEEIVGRARQAFAEGVVELWLTSEDTGAYGRDIDASLPELLWKVVEVVPEGSMLRLGMTNPPYILQHLEEMSRILAHPRVYSFLHVPVQSGSNCVLEQMRREYIVEEFRHVVDYLLERVPGITIATDVICGFPSETSEDFEETMELVREYRFPVLFINQFYPRPGTAAARMTRLPTQEVKGRSRRLSKLFHSYLPYENRVGERERVLVTERASDGCHFVGHDKSYRQVLVPGDGDSLLGRMVDVEIVSAGKHYLVGRPLPSSDPPSHPFSKTRLMPYFLMLVSMVMVFVVAMVTKLLLPPLSSAS